MTLAEVRDWLRLFGAAEHYYIGRLENKKEKSLGVYSRGRSGPPVMALGGLSCSSYGVKAVTLLLHWNKNANETEAAALALWDRLLGLTAGEMAAEDAGDGDITLSGGIEWTAEDQDWAVILRPASQTKSGGRVQYVDMRVPEPVAVGTDEGGVYEYVVDMDIYYRR